MTYPPQPPGPYGSQPPPDPYGQQPGPYGGPPPPPQPDPFRPQSSYQGLGSYPTGPSEPPPPKKSNTGTIVAIVLVALLVLGGGGTAVYFLTKKKDDNSNSASNNQPGDNTSTSSPRTSGSQGGSSGDTSSEEQTPSPRGSDSPAEVQQAYIAAYEAKRFTNVVNSACDAYKKKFGTDTTDLEKQLAPYDIKATADGTPQVDGSTATAKINLELTKGSETKKPKIQIKIVKESGSWKFCGEGEA